KKKAMTRVTKKITVITLYLFPSAEQNEIIEIMSDTVKEEIVREIGDSWYTVKVDGMRDPTGCENISIVIRFLAENYDIKERLLTIATTDTFDALLLTNTVIAEIMKAGLSTFKVLSQCYDGASLMSGRHGGVQKLMQEKLEQEIPYIHCFNHQLHLVIVHAMSSERGVEEFFNVCDSLYKFIRKPTVAVHYKGEKLKGLLEQRWTGHYGTVSVITKSFDSIFELLTEVENTRAHGTDVRIEATGLLKEISAPHFKFIAHMVHKILQLLDAANKMLQAEQTDLLSAVKVIQSASECISKLRSESDFNEL
uniref:DUF4371 domain-containing protein n=1 Tax=Latimeria chalumnae TaxID=7897 RepID=H3BAF9_LATCH